MRPLSLLSVLLIPFLSFSQEAKVNIESLNIFSDSKEKAIFANIQNKDSGDYFHLLLLSDNYSSKKTDRSQCAVRINDFIASQENASNQQLSSKDIKKLYKTIHDAFLVKYETNPGFSEIFVTGTYNCATASALYALVLQKMNIPFEIRETPNHVYIVAAPLTHNIIFETTAPGAMVYQFNDKMKDEFVKYLVNNKLISKEEADNTDKNQLFEKYFYTDKPINLRQLTGLHYYNRGIEAAQKENFLDAYNNFEKALFLYPDAKMKYFTATSLAAVMSKKYGTEEDSLYKYYIRYGQIANEALSRDFISSYYEKFAKKLLVERPDTLKYFQLYNTLISQVKDTALLQELKSDHYFDLGRYYYLKDDYHRSISYMDSAFSLNKENLLFKELLTDLVNRLIIQIPDTKKAIDSIDFYLARYPYLNENGKVSEYQVFCLCKETSKCYEMKDDHKNGQKYFQKLQAVLKDHPTFYVKHEMYIQPTYTTVASYYVRKQDYKSARAILVEIDKFLPEDEEIDRRLKHVEKMIAQGKK